MKKNVQLLVGAVVLAGAAYYFWDKDKKAKAIAAAKLSTATKLPKTTSNVPASTDVSTTYAPAPLDVSTTYAPAQFVGSSTASDAHFAKMSLVGQVTTVASKSKFFEPKDTSWGNK